MRNATSKRNTQSNTKGQSRRRARRLAPSAANTPITEENLVESVRRAFFAKAGEPATKYGVSIEQVLSHIEVAEEYAYAKSEATRRNHISRIPTAIEDIVQATACCHGVGMAWQDCRNMHEHLLVRACEMRLQEIDAMLFVRRFWEELESRTRGDSACGSPRMQDYLGNRPLRVWLADRLLGRLEKLTRTGTLDGIARRPELGEFRADLRLVE
jgi:hypothetical protein